MIKKSLLENLVGEKVNLAQQAVVAAGHKVYLVPAGVQAITMEAKPNTVVLWQEAGKVTYADAGDGLELET